MDEAKIKGSFIRRAIEFASRKVGKDALKEFPKPPEFYHEEHWYPFEEFCQCLIIIENMFYEDRKDTLFLAGRDMMKRDPRWSVMFRGKDPKDVFGVNTRQDDQVRIGDFEIQNIDEKHLRIRMHLWSNDAEQSRLWGKYYLGCSQTIMDLTGKKGTVSFRPDPENLAIIYFEFHW